MTWLCGMYICLDCLASAYFCTILVWHVNQIIICRRGNIAEIKASRVHLRWAKLQTCQWLFNYCRNWEHNLLTIFPFIFQLVNFTDAAPSACMVEAPGGKMVFDSCLLSR